MVIDSGGVTDIVLDHDGGVHRLEVEHRDPRMQTSLDIVHITTGDFAVGGDPIGHRHGDIALIGQPYHQTVEKLAGRAVGGGVETDLGYHAERFLASYRLNGAQDCQRQFSISGTVLYHLIGSARPLLVHLAGIDIHLLQFFSLGKQHPGDKLERLSFRPQ